MFQFHCKSFLKVPSPQDVHSSNLTLFYKRWIHLIGLWFVTLTCPSHVMQGRYVCDSKILFFLYVTYMSGERERESMFAHLIYNKVSTITHFKRVQLLVLLYIDYFDCKLIQFAVYSCVFLAESRSCYNQVHP